MENGALTLSVNCQLLILCCRWLTDNMQCVLQSQDGTDMHKLTLVLLMLQLLHVINRICFSQRTEIHPCNCYGLSV
jgi:hypothetical protein